MSPAMQESIDIENVIDALSRTGNYLSNQMDITVDQRTRLLKACEKLSSQIMPLRNKIWDLGFKGFETTAIRVAMDMRIFDLAGKSTTKELTPQQISSHAGADPVLALSIGLFTITPQGMYKPGPWVNDLAQGRPLSDMITFIHDVMLPACQKLPEFLSKTGYQNPSDANACPFQYAFETNDHLYTWLSKNPAIYSAFCGLMKAMEQNAICWPDIFDVHERFKVFQGPSPAEPLQLVDVGGGIGHKIQYLKETMPDLVAEFTLQDLPEVLKNVPAGMNADIQPMPHDFFQPQPVKGATVYVLARILHNWPDADCRKILRHTRDAMNDRSTLLIHEGVFTPGAGEVYPLDVVLDMVMMVSCGSMERSESQFRELLASEGLDLVRVWRVKNQEKSQEGVLEVRKKRLD
ncbi:hypothetical protein FE257_008193 [Aspergillus nanangensis]|uniref:O-methyltransferase C-terminal domain-containing protein n=1 Tax=Aspergillus nanangensis TaxID=2582783 RepID=A0AAD4GST2_ASPNN|nr:hypothetical protein FE257_008193 [Aspergillus nanangensis]